MLVQSFFKNSWVLLCATVLAVACNSGGSDTIIGTKCQAKKFDGQTDIRCPKGYFCKYEDEVDMNHPNATGVCRIEESYKECKDHGPCNSLAPKCKSANAVPHCDAIRKNVLCECEFPEGVPVEDSEGEIVKTPTTTE